jgi:4-aminobutyrate aminotransferase-like enzyme
MREEGVLIGTEGPHGNVLKIRPPMPFTAEDAETLCGALDRIFGELE